MSRDPVQTFRALRRAVASIDEDIERAVRNLREIQPGFGSTTPMNGSPGGGSGWSRGSSSVVERLAGTVDDEAAVALEFINAAVPDLARLVLDLQRTVQRWAYPTAGESGEHRRGSARDVNAYAKAGCSSCARPEVLQHVEVYRDGLCRWCYDFRAAEHMLPPVPLLKLRHEGGTSRLTPKVIAHHVRIARQTQQRRRTRRRR
jgi:hypothetical protein